MASSTVFCAQAPFSLALPPAPPPPTPYSRFSGLTGGENPHPPCPLLTHHTTGRRHSGASTHLRAVRQIRSRQPACRSPPLRSSPRRIALFIEPSPFSYISGYKNRFLNFIKYLREMGDEVLVVTTHKGAPAEFYGAKVIASWSFPFPWYTVVPLSLALSPRIIVEVTKFKPDIIHASSPGIMVFGALIISRVLNTPLVLSYHTNVPQYIPKYTFSWLVKPMWWVIKLLHTTADLTLVTSSAVGRDLQQAGAAAVYKIRLWSKGVDSDSFNPCFKSKAMRARLTNGELERPLIIHVGRLGIEKNLGFLAKVMEKIPDACLAFIGDGPCRQELEKLFDGRPVVFTGMLHGEDLSKAYASGDVFVTPSELETLGFVVLEAMASGVPVVAARAGGIPDIISPSQEGQTGFLFSPGDVDECVRKIKALLASEDLRRRIGTAARAEAEKHDWRSATKHVRNDGYDAAMQFWQKRSSNFLHSLAAFVTYLHHNFISLIDFRHVDKHTWTKRAILFACILAFIRWIMISAA